MADLEQAIALAVEAHHGQRRRDGSPYILHPLRMMLRLNTDDERIVAMLHDVLEKSSFTRQDLERKGFSVAVVEAVDSMSKRPGEPYESLIERAAGNPLARVVKLADLEDNMNLRELPAVTPEAVERLERSHRAWLRLKHQP